MVWTWAPTRRTPILEGLHRNACQRGPKSKLEEQKAEVGHKGAKEQIILFKETSKKKISWRVQIVLNAHVYSRLENWWVHRETPPNSWRQQQNAAAFVWHWTKNLKHRRSLLPVLSSQLSHSQTKQKSKIQLWKIYLGGEGGAGGGTRLQTLNRIQQKPAWLIEEVSKT